MPDGDQWRRTPAAGAPGWRGEFPAHGAFEQPLLVEVRSVVARDRSVVRSLSSRQIEHDLVDIAPAPTFRRIVALDHGMAGGVEMRRRMLVGGIVAAADMAAGTADAQVQPAAAGF